VLAVVPALYGIGCMGIGQLISLLRIMSFIPLCFLLFRPVVFFLVFLWRRLVWPERCGGMPFFFLSSSCSCQDFFSFRLMRISCVAPLRIFEHSCVWVWFRFNCRYLPGILLSFLNVFAEGWDY